MTLDKRQQNIVMWVLIVIGGAIGFYYVLLNPLYLSPIADLKKNIATQKKIARDNADLIARAKAANVKWYELRIPTDSSAMEKDLRDTVLIAANRNYGNFVVSKWSAAGSRPYSVPRTPTRLDTKTDFQELKFTANANTTMSHISRFLTYFESLKIPAKIDGVKIASRKSGNDDLNIEVSLSALVYAPKGGIPNDPFMPASVKAQLAAATQAGAGLNGGLAPFGSGLGTPGMIGKSPDPALPAGDTMEARLKARRALQLSDTPPDTLKK